MDTAPPKRVFSEEHRRKLSEKAKGRVFSEEHKRNLSIARQGVPQRRGWHHTPETCARMSASRKGYKNALGYKHTAEARRKISEKNRGRAFTKAHRRKLSLSLKRVWTQFSPQEQQHRACTMVWGARLSSLERIMQCCFREVNVKFESQKAFLPYFVDIFIPSLNLVVECDGEYWHSSLTAQRRDQKRDRYLISRYGVRIVRVPEKSILENPKLVVSTILGGIRKEHEPHE